MRLQHYQLLNTLMALMAICPKLADLSHRAANQTQRLGSRLGNN